MRRLLLTTAVAAAVAAGCGDDDEKGRTVTVKGGAEVRVAGHEYRFDPQTVVVQAGGGQSRVAIGLANEGSLAHNLKLFEGDRELGGTATVEGGGDAGAELELDRGSYRMVCTVGDHAELGMTGRLEVR